MGIRIGSYYPAPRHLTHIQTICPSAVVRGESSIKGRPNLKRTGDCVLRPKLPAREPARDRNRKARIRADKFENKFNFRFGAGPQAEIYLDS